MRLGPGLTAEMEGFQTELHIRFSLCNINKLFSLWANNLYIFLSFLQVPVLISIKGRIILEILEGMVYLMKNRVIHKDLKPENILVDKDFHIKVQHTLYNICRD